MWLILLVSGEMYSPLIISNTSYTRSKTLLIVYVTFSIQDPCEGHKCTAPYNIGCKAINEKPVCQCPPPCPEIRPRPYVCASDDETYKSRCHMERHSCLTDTPLTVSYFGTCRKYNRLLLKFLKMSLVVAQSSD